MIFVAIDSTVDDGLTSLVPLAFAKINLIICIYGILIIHKVILFKAIMIKVFDKLKLVSAEASILVEVLLLTPIIPTLRAGIVVFNKLENLIQSLVILYVRSAAVRVLISLCFSVLNHRHTFEAIAKSIVFFIF